MSGDKSLFRQRDSVATRALILSAAKSAFSSRGAEVGLREIAKAARVNVALINRYFGSKDALLREVMCAAPPNFSLILQADRSNFGRNLASGLVAGCHLSSTFDPTIVLLRSLGHADALATLMSVLDAWLNPLSEALGGSDSRLRAELIFAAMAGFSIFGRVAKTKGIAETPDLVLVEILGKTIQSYVD